MQNCRFPKTLEYLCFPFCVLCVSVRLKIRARTFVENLIHLHLELRIDAFMHILWKLDLGATNWHRIWHFGVRSRMTSKSRYPRAYSELLGQPPKVLNLRVACSQKRAFRARQTAPGRNVQKHLVSRARRMHTSINTCRLVHAKYYLF